MEDMWRTYASTGATANDNDATRRAKLGLSGTQINSAFMLDPRWKMPGHPGLSFTDWQDAIERKGAIQNYEVSLSGGTDAVKYFVSGNYADQDGFIIGIGYKAYSMRRKHRNQCFQKIEVRCEHCTNIFHNTGSRC